MVAYWVKDANRNNHINKMFYKGLFLIGVERYRDWTKCYWI